MASLQGRWKDDDGNIATIADSSGSLSFTPDTRVWWSTGDGSWKQGVDANSGDFHGHATFQDDSGNKTALNFCVGKSADKIMFSNSKFWERQS